MQIIVSCNDTQTTITVDDKYTVKRLYEDVAKQCGSDVDQIFILHGQNFLIRGDESTVSQAGVCEGESVYVQVGDPYSHNQGSGSSSSAGGLATMPPPMPAPMTLETVQLVVPELPPMGDEVPQEMKGLATWLGKVQQQNATCMQSVTSGLNNNIHQLASQLIAVNGQVAGLQDQLPTLRQDILAEVASMIDKRFAQSESADVLEPGQAHQKRPRPDGQTPEEISIPRGWTPCNVTRRQHGQQSQLPVDPLQLPGGDAWQNHLNQRATAASVPPAGAEDVRLPHGSSLRHEQGRWKCYVRDEFYYADLVHVKGFAPNSDDKDLVEFMKGLLEEAADQPFHSAVVSHKAAFSQGDRYDLVLRTPKSAMEFVNWFRSGPRVHGSHTLRCLINKTPSSSRRDGRAWEMLQTVQEIISDAKLIWGSLNINVRRETIARYPRDGPDYVVNYALVERECGADVARRLRARLE